MFSTSLAGVIKPHVTFHVEPKRAPMHKLADLYRKGKREKYSFSQERQEYPLKFQFLYFKLHFRKTSSRLLMIAGLAAFHHPNPSPRCRPRCVRPFPPRKQLRPELPISRPGHPLRIVRGHHRPCLHCLHWQGLRRRSDSRGSAFEFELWRCLRGQERIATSCRGCRATAGCLDHGATPFHVTRHGYVEQGCSLRLAGALSKLWALMRGAVCVGFGRTSGARETVHILSVSTSSVACSPSGVW